MAYAQGGLIEAVDFNTFRAQLLNIYGVGFGNSGYGQTAITVPAVLGGLVELVKSVEWTALRNALEVCALHQGISTALIPRVTELEPSDPIVAYDGITNAANFGAMLTNIAATRLTAATTSTSLIAGVSDQVVAGSWSNSAFTLVDLVWPSVDAARYFFNSGGQIIVRASFTPAGVTPHNTSWENLLNNVGSVIINHNNTVSTGSIGTAANIGYYTMTPTAPDDLLFNASPPGGGAYYYADNTYQITGRTIGLNGATGDNGHTMRLRIDLDDNFTGGTDVVNGTLRVTIDERRATTHLTIPSFTVNLATPLTIS